MTLLIIRRTIFWLIMAVTVIIPIWFMVAAGRSAGRPVEHFFVYIYVTQSTTVALAIWSIIFVRKEPVLVRLALVVIIVVSYNTIWVHKL